jgi:uncharacterized protein YPO0396
MRFTNISLRNWRNFLTVDVALQERMFVVGPNASGKSNLLDAFRFLRDLADPRGGFQQAVQLRHGVARLRSLHARRYPAEGNEGGDRPHAWFFSSYRPRLCGVSGGFHQGTLAPAGCRSEK